MNEKLLDYYGNKLVDFCLSKKDENGDIRITMRQACNAINISTNTWLETKAYLENIGVVYFRSKTGSHSGTQVIVCDTELKKWRENQKKEPTEQEIDDIVYGRVTTLGASGKQFTLLAGDLKKDNVKPIALGNSLKRLAIAGLITCRPIIIDEKWLVKVCVKEPEQTPKDEPIKKGVCPKCGTKLPDGAKFCFMCGERMPKTEMEQLHDRFNEVLSRVARMYNNSERANKDIDILQKVAGIAFKEAI